MMNKHKNSNKRNKTIKLFFRNNIIIICTIIFVFVLICAIVIDKKEIAYVNKNTHQIHNNNLNHDAVITVIDGESENTFTKVWGGLIQDGYPICSNLVNNWVGTDGFMSWDTIEALNDIGVEFIFHTTEHNIYSSMSLEQVAEDIRIGIKEMNEHGLNNRFIVWRNKMSDDIYKIGESMLDGGFSYSEGINTIAGEKDSPIKMQYEYDASNYSIDQLISLINDAKTNNGWLILFTRNNKMDETQIDIYRQAFEYAKEHNVAVVTASEGYDLYYGNRLGSNNQR